MSKLIEKLNIAIAKEIDGNEGVVFCAKNYARKLHCKLEFVEQALNDAGYYEEDGDFTQNDLIAIAEVVDDYGSAAIDESETMEKAIWFDINSN